MKMILHTLTTFLILFVAMAPLQGDAAGKTLSEKEKINALIVGLENLKGAAFIRNGDAYDAKAAAKFLRGKWQTNEKSIKTAADFIEKAASISSTSGRPYLIRLKGVSEVKCGDYLKAELKKLDGSSKASEPSALK